MSSQLKQCIYIDQNLEVLTPLEEYFHIASRPDPASLSFSGISLNIDNQELLGAEFEFGQVNLLKYQWKTLLNRLKDGLPGIICDGRHDAYASPKLIFEPGKYITQISIAYFSEEFDLHLPIDGLLGNLKAGDLFQYLDSYLKSGLKPIQGLLYQSHFTRLGYPSLQLLQEINTAIEQIDELYTSLGIPLELEFYYDR